MRLRLGRARADRVPANQVGEILRRQWIERFTAGGQSHRGERKKQFARAPHPRADAERIVHVGIVDVALPAGRRARLLEVDAHHQQQRIADLVGEGPQPPGVLERRARVMDRARSDDDEQARVGAVENARQLCAPKTHGLGAGGAERQFVLDHNRRRHVVEADDIQVVGDSGV